MSKFIAFVVSKKVYIVAYIVGASLTIAGIYTKNWQMVVTGITLITGHAAIAIEATNIIETIAAQGSNPPAASSSTVSGQ